MRKFSLKYLHLILYLFVFILFIFVNINCEPPSPESCGTRELSLLSDDTEICDKKVNACDCEIGCSVYENDCETACKTELILPYDDPHDDGIRIVCGPSRYNCDCDSRCSNYAACLNNDEDDDGGYETGLCGINLIDGYSCGNSEYTCSCHEGCTGYDEFLCDSSFHFDINHMAITYDASQLGVGTSSLHDEVKLALNDLGYSDPTDEHIDDIMQNGCLTMSAYLLLKYYQAPSITTYREYFVQGCNAEPPRISEYYGGVIHREELWSDYMFSEIKIIQFMNYESLLQNQSFSVGMYTYKISSDYNHSFIIFKNGFEYFVADTGFGIKNGIRLKDDDRIMEPTFISFILLE